MHDDEHVPDEAVVAALLQDQFPDLAGLPLTRVASTGTDNVLYRVGDEVLARFPRVGWASGDPVKEQHWLGVLAEVGRVQRPLGLGRPGHGYPWSWSLLTWVEGHGPRTGPGLTALARDLAGWARRLHAVDPGRGALDGKNRGQPLADRDDATREALEGVVDEVDAGWALAEWERALEAPTWAGAPVVVHGDLTAGNVLVDPGGGLAAVLDLGSLNKGDPAVDLLPAWVLFEGTDRQAYCAALGADEAMVARSRGWALSVSLLELVYYRTGRNPALAERARTVLAALRASS